MRKSRLEIWLTFMASFAWPLSLVLLVLLFQGQITELTGRVRTGEFAGAKFTFAEAAAGYIRASVNDLAKEQNPQKREALAENIRSVADALGALHPRSLGILITGTKGCHVWVDDAYLSEKQYFKKIEEMGLVKVIERKRDNKLEAFLAYTKKGKELLVSIGFSRGEVADVDRCG
jgi:hypothetical protein